MKVRKILIFIVIGLLVLSTGCQPEAGNTSSTSINKEGQPPSMASVPEPYTELILQIVDEKNVPVPNILVGMAGTEEKLTNQKGIVTVAFSELEFSLKNGDYDIWVHQFHMNGEEESQINSFSYQKEVNFYTIETGLSPMEIERKQHTPRMEIMVTDKANNPIVNYYVLCVANAPSQPQMEEDSEELSPSAKFLRQGFTDHEGKVYIPYESEGEYLIFVNQIASQKEAEQFRYTIESVIDIVKITVSVEQ